MWHFGFSYVGLIMLLMLFIPNIIWAKFQPVDYDKYVIKENKVLLAFERIGQILVCPIVLIFSDFNINKISYWSLFLLLAFVSMILYEIYWIRYFKSKRTMKDMYRGILFIPLAGATLPVIAFLLLAIYGKNPFLGIVMIILGIGHIGIHYQHKKEIIKDDEKVYIWCAIDVDSQLIDQKEAVKKIENGIKFGTSNVSLLPLHVSLKISSPVSIKDEKNLRNDIKNLYNSIDKFFIEVEGIELNKEIVWIKMKENDNLKRLHNELCSIYSKYGIKLHEFDNSFTYHATLFLDKDESKIMNAYEKIKNINLPTKLIAERFIIGSSKSGKVGSYSVDTIEQK